VRGTPEELARSRALIHDFERDPAAACHNPIGPTISPAMAADLARMQKQLEGVFSVDVRPKLAGPNAEPTRVGPDATPAPERRK
jgi:hypothetical protein